MHFEKIPLKRQRLLLPTYISHVLYLRAVMRAVLFSTFPSESYLKFYLRMDIDNKIESKTICFPLQQHQLLILVVKYNL